MARELATPQCHAQPFWRAWQPTPANLEMARKLDARIRAQIQAGTFVFSEVFPKFQHSGRRGVDHGAVETNPAATEDAVSTPLRCSVDVGQLEPDDWTQCAAGDQGTRPPSVDHVEGVRRVGRRCAGIRHPRDSSGAQSEGVEAIGHGKGTARAPVNDTRPIEPAGTRRRVITRTSRAPDTRTRANKQSPSPGDSALALSAHRASPSNYRRNHGGADGVL